MAKLMLYLLESSAVLAFFYLLYVLVLRKETFFDLNRFFLLGILVFSLLFPFLSFDFNPTKVTAVEQPIQEISKIRMSYYDAMDAWMFENQSRATDRKSSENTSLAISSMSWTNLALLSILIIYTIGIIVCLSRTFWTMRWIWKMISNYPKELIEGVAVIKIPNPIAPFSFLKYVFIQETMIHSQEFDQILAHERTHIQEKHSLDLIFVQFLAAFFWFNPLIWQLIKSLKTAHEYIADKKMINTGYSLVEYQTLLLRQLISNNSYGLVHNFNLSFIKKRITMMKNQKSGWSGKVKVAMTIASAVIFSVLIVQCNSAIDDQVSIESEALSVDDVSSKVNLPLLPNVLHSTYDHNDALSFSIANDRLFIDGIAHQISEIPEVIEKSDLTNQGAIIMKVDAKQSMKMVRDVHTELRRADRRKVLYVGQTSSGEKIELAMLLPPLPGDTRPGVPQLPKIDDEYIARTGLDVLKIHLGDNEGSVNRDNVDALVRKHIAKQSSNYVVSAKFKDTDTYDSYLVGLVYINEGFNQIYEERSQEMFGKNYLELDKQNPEEKEQYLIVRQGIPRAISIAEKD